jgi:hypothetical protein
VEVFYITKLRIRWKKVEGNTYTLYIKVCATIESFRQLQTDVIINRTAILAIINLGATSNFMYAKTAK